MPFDVNAAREAGYSDDEIQQHLSSRNPNFKFAEAKSAGYSLDEIVSHLAQKGGEVNEEQTSSKSGSQRKGDQQIQPSPVEGIQPSQEPRGGNGQEREGQIDPSIAPAKESDVPLTAQPIQQGGEKIEEDAKTEGQRAEAGQEAGKGLRGEGNARDKAQVTDRGNVPSVASKVAGGLISPFGYIGEEGWKGIAGIARTIGADEVANYAMGNSARALEDSVELVGGTAPERGSALETAGKIGAFAIEAPLMFSGGIGLTGFLAQGYGGMKEDLRNKYLQEGMSEDEANSKSSIHAGLNTAAMIPAYMFGGFIAGKAADAFIAKSSPAVLQLAGRFGLNGAANMVASAAARGFGAAIEGEDAGSAAKDFTLSGVLQDFAFAGHSTGEWFKKQTNLAAAVKELPDGNLQYLVDKTNKNVTPDERFYAEQEIESRKTEKQKTEATDAGLPETAEVIGEKPVEVKPLVEEDQAEVVGEEIPTEEAPHFEQEPAGKRIRAAAYRDPETGLIHEGESHVEAMDAAGKERIEEAAGRETEDFGYTTENGEFVSRKKAEEIAKESGQFLGKKIEPDGTMRPVMHSNEVNLDYKPSDLTGRVESKKLFGKNAKQALDVLSKHPDTTDTMRVLIDGLKKFVGSKKLSKDLFRRLPTLGEEGYIERAEAFRNKETKRIHIEPKSVRVATVLHEMFHTLTQDELDLHVYHGADETGGAYLKRLNESLERKDTPEPIKRLITLYKLTLSKHSPETFKKYFGEKGIANDETIGLHEIYGFANLHEFISEAFTNKKFQDILKRMEGDEGKSMWQSFLDTIARAFNIPNGSMLESVIDASLGIAKIERKGKLMELEKGASEKIRPSMKEPFDEQLDALIEQGKKDREESKKPKPEPEGYVYDPRDEEGAMAAMESAFSVGNGLKELEEMYKDINDKMPEVKTPISVKISNKVDSLVKAKDLFQDDLNAMGVKGAGKLIKESGKGLFTGVRNAVTMISDVLEGKTIPALTKAGVKLTTTYHAQSRRMIAPYVQHLISKVFPNEYKISKEGIEEIYGIKATIKKAEKRLARSKLAGNAENVARQEQILVDANKDLNDARNKYDATRKTMDIINKDNILAGADTINDETAKVTKALEELKDLYEKGEAPKGAKGEIKDMEEKLEALAYSLKAIEDLHNLGKYEEEVMAAKGTSIEENINRWKEVIHPLMNELYDKLNDHGEPSEIERGRIFGARVNLLADFEAKRLEELENADGPTPPMMGVNYRNPDIKKDVQAFKAAFNSVYSNDVEAVLTNAFASRMNEASKLDVYNDLINKGVAQIAEYGERISEINGKPTRLLQAKFPVREEKKGTTRMVDKSIYVQADLYNELMQILDVNIRPEQNPVLGAVTKIQIIGIADATSHLKNLLSVVTNGLGRDSALKDIISKIPIVGSINAIREIRSVMKEIQADGPKIREQKAEIARLSGLRPHYEQTGMMKMLTKHQHDLLYETDVAARIIMNRRYSQLVERFGADASPEARIDFVNQIGEYNRRLMSRHEAALRDVGFSPFIVAGRAMNRMARRLVTGYGGFEARDAKTNLQVRAIQASGLVMAAIVPAMINLMTTGSMFGRNGTPVGAIDFGPNFDTSDGKKRTFDLFQLVGIRRGLRQLGLNAAIEGIKNGSSVKEIQKNALNDMFTTSLHPFIGPGVGLGFEVLTGKRLDMRTGFSDIYTSRKVGGVAQYIENFRTGLKQQNELLYGIGAGYAIEKGMELGGIPRPVEQGEIETLRDMNLPEIPVISQVGKVAYKALSVAVAAGGGKLNVSPALKLSAQLGSKQQYDPIQDLRYQARKEIIEAVKGGEKQKAYDLYNKGIKSGLLTQADNKTIKGQIKQPDLLLQRTARLKTAEDAVSVFRVSDAKEQDAIALTVIKKIKGSTAITPQAKKALFDEVKRTMSKGSKLYQSLNK